MPIRRANRMVAPVRPAGSSHRYQPGDGRHRGRQEQGACVLRMVHGNCLDCRRTREVPKGCRRYPQPVVLLARLGVSVEHEGRGLGAGLLGDVIGRTSQLGIETGCRGLLVQAESAGVRDFYLHLVPEFELLPTDDLYLVLLMKDILKTFTG